MTIAYSYFVLAILLNSPLDINAVGGKDLLRVRSADKACLTGKIIAVEERLPSVKRLDTMEWVGGFMIECGALKDRYREIPTSLFEGDK